MAEDTKRHDFNPVRFIDFFSKARDIDGKVAPIVNYLDDVVEGTSAFADSLQASPKTSQLVSDAQSEAQAVQSAYLGSIADLSSYLRGSSHVLIVEGKKAGRSRAGDSTYEIDIATPNFRKGTAVRDPALAIIEVLRWIKGLPKMEADTDVRAFMGTLGKIDLPDKINMESYGLFEHDGVVYRAQRFTGDTTLSSKDYASVMSGLAKLANETGVRFQFSYIPFAPKPF